MDEAEAIKTTRSTTTVTAEVKKLQTRIMASQHGSHKNLKEKKIECDELHRELTKKMERYQVDAAKVHAASSRR